MRGLCRLVRPVGVICGLLDFLWVFFPILGWCGQVPSFVVSGPRCLHDHLTPVRRLYARSPLSRIAFHSSYIFYFLFGVYLIRSAGTFGFCVGAHCPIIALSLASQHYSSQLFLFFVDSSSFSSFSLSYTSFLCSLRLAMMTRPLSLGLHTKSPLNLSLFP